MSFGSSSPKSSVSARLVETGWKLGAFESTGGDVLGDVTNLIRLTDWGNDLREN